jgi:hypothetical protein
MRQRNVLSVDASPLFIEMGNMPAGKFRCGLIIPRKFILQNQVIGFALKVGRQTASIAAKYNVRRVFEMADRMGIIFYIKIYGENFGNSATWHRICIFFNTLIKK